MAKHAKQALSTVLDPVGDAIGAGLDVVDQGIETVGDVGSDVLDATADVLETASEPVFEVMDAVGETVIEPIADNVIKPALDTGFDLFLPSYNFNISFLRAFHCSYLCLRASFSADGVCIGGDLLRFDFLGGDLLLLLLLDIFNDLILDSAL